MVPFADNLSIKTDLPKVVLTVEGTTGKFLIGSCLLGLTLVLDIL